MPANLPYSYDYMNAVISETSPSTVHCNSVMSGFFRRYLFQRAISVFKWEMPEEWAENYVLGVLYSEGFTSVIDTDQFGVIPSYCTLSGRNVQYQPSYALISNPLLKRYRRRLIGVECGLLLLNPDYRGIRDLVAFYGDMMALCAQGAGITELNSRLAYVFGTDTKASAETFKKLFDTIASGNPAAVTDKSFFDEQGRPRWQMFLQNVGANYIAPQQLETMRRWEQHFDSEIGIPVAYEKGERLNVPEVQVNQFEACARADATLKRLQKCCNKINNLFGDRMSSRLWVDWRYNPMRGVNVDARETFDNGAARMG